MLNKRGAAGKLVGADDPCDRWGDGWAFAADLIRRLGARAVGFDYI